MLVLCGIALAKMWIAKATNGMKEHHGKVDFFMKSIVTDEDAKYWRNESKMGGSPKKRRRGS